MKNVDIIYMNMSPIIDNQEKRSIEKSNHIKEILRNRILNNKEEIKINNIIMFTYQPMKNENWMRFVELFLEKEIENECIIVFNNMLDLSATPYACYSILVNMIANKKFKEIYP